jgi:hypothetical protein
MSQLTSALLWGGVFIVLSSAALQRLAAIVKKGSIPGLRGEEKYRRNLRLILGLFLAGVALLLAAGLSTLLQK